MDNNIVDNNDALTHEKHTLNIYGITGHNFHVWIDEPVRITGNHRKYRHDPNQEIPKCFVDEYGENMARNILLDHICFDKKESLKREFEKGYNNSLSDKNGKNQKYETI